MTEERYWVLDDPLSIIPSPAAHGRPTRPWARYCGRLLAKDAGDFNPNWPTGRKAVALIVGRER